MITIIIPYFEQPHMYQLQLDNFAELKGDYKVIFIDDCSREPIQTVPEHTYYRITEDKGINWQGAKNLGAYVADTEWILHTDLDHLIPQKTLDGIAENLEYLDKKTAYKFERKKAGQKKAPHPNSFLVTRDVFLATEGYDLRFQGTKGGEFTVTRKLNFKTLPWHLETYGLDQVVDAMTPVDDEKQREKLTDDYQQMEEQPLINFEYELL